MGCQKQFERKTSREALNEVIKFIDKTNLGCLLQQLGAHQHPVCNQVQDMQITDRLSIWLEINREHLHLQVYV